MAYQSRTFRVFVSSTFSDLKEERNALQKRVFPRLSELCEQNGYRFQAIDLRWGVSEEAALHHQSMRICLEEIARCQRLTPRPYFIALLGDRYGWCPLPYGIPAGQFEEILRNVPETGERAFLSHWYKRDENAVPPIYDLQPRTGAYANSAKWKSIEHYLRSILLEAVNKIPLEPDQMVKYIASATEQEIFQGILRLQDAAENVFCFFRSIMAIGDVPPDRNSGNFVDLDSEGNLDQKAYIRSRSLKELLDLMLPGNVHSYQARWMGEKPTIDHIDQLCEDVFVSLSQKIQKEIAQIGKVPPLEREIADHEVFGDERAKSFTGRAAVLQTISDYIGRDDRRPLVISGASGTGKTALVARAFREARKSHPGAQVVLRFIGATANSLDGRSLLESLCLQISRGSFIRMPSGEFPPSSAPILSTDDLRPLGYDPQLSKASLSEDCGRLAREFSKQLKRASKKKPLILFLDALDQLYDAEHGRDPVWLPAELPEHVSLIVSTLPGEYLSALERELPASNRIEIKPMPLNEGKELLARWLESAGRTLQEHQRNEILDAFAGCRLPLYLKLVFEEARRWKSYTEENPLSPDILGTVRDFFKRLSMDISHGEMVVSRSLGYLAAAKNGLSEDELLDLLSCDEAVMQDFTRRAYHKLPEKRLPVVIWSRLFLDLEPYLTERRADDAMLLTFYHRQLAEGATKEYLTEGRGWNPHSVLADYFDNQPLYIESEGKKTYNLRKMSELPHQLICGELWEKLEQTLTDPDFVEAKCKAGMMHELADEYAHAERVWPGREKESRSKGEWRKRIESHAQEMRAYARAWNQARVRHQADPEQHSSPDPDAISFPEPPPSVEVKNRNCVESIREKGEWTSFQHVEAWHHFVNNHAFALAGNDIPAFQLAYNSADSGPVHEALEKRLERGEGPEQKWLRLINPPPYTSYPALLKALQIDKYRGGFLALSPDGRRMMTESTVGDRWEVRLWDLETGQCLKTLEGVGRVKALVATLDGCQVVSRNSENIVHLWNSETGERLRTLEGHSCSLNVRAVAITPDGRRAILGSYDNSVRLWDLETGQCLETLKVHSQEERGGIGAVGVTADGRQASLWYDYGWYGYGLDDYDKGVCFLDLATRRLGEVLKVPRYVGLGSACAVASNGRRIVDWYSDRGFVWDLEKDERFEFLQKHGHTQCLALTPDGRRALTGSGNTLRLWDLDPVLSLEAWEGSPSLPTIQCLKTLEATSHIGAVALTPDGRQTLTGSRNILYLWNLETGDCLKTLETTSFVGAVAFTPDGCRAVTGSDTVHLWDLETGQCLETLEGHASTFYLTAFAATPDGYRAVTGSKRPKETKKVRIWDLETGQCLKTMEHHEAIHKSFDIDCVAITADGRLAISGDRETIGLWDLETGQCIKSRRRNSSRTEAGNRIVAFTPDGSLVVYLDRPGALCAWNLNTDRCQNISDDGEAYGIHAVAVTADGQLAITGGGAGTVRVWDLKTGECLKTLEEGTGPSHSVESMAATADGRLAITGSRDGTVRLWNLERGRDCKNTERKISFIIKADAIPGGRFAVSGNDDGTVRVWDFEMGECLKILEGHTDMVRALAVSADGSRIVSIGQREDKTLRVWDLETGQCLKTLKGITDATLAVALTPEGRRAITGNYTDSHGRRGPAPVGLDVLDLETGQCLKTLVGHVDRAETVATSPDGRLVVSGSNDRTVRVWDLETGQCLKILKGHSHGVNTIAITADGRRIVSGSQDGTLRIWDLRTNECLKVLEDHRSDRRHKLPVGRAVVTPDSRWLITESRGDQSEVHLWDMATGQCIWMQEFPGKRPFCVVSQHVHFMVNMEMKDSPRIDLVQLGNSPYPYPPILTPTRFWLSGQFGQLGDWDDRLTVVCQWCGKLIAPDSRVLDVIKDITRSVGLPPDQSPSMTLPDEAWEEPELFSECPLCHKTIKFNPFTVGDRERY